MRLGPRPAGSSTAASPKAAQPKPRPKPTTQPKPVPAPPRRRPKSEPQLEEPQLEELLEPEPIQQPAPINDIADPIFGSGQKISSAPAPMPPATAQPGPVDLFESMEPNAYETAYAPPAPIANRPRQQTHRRKSTKNPAGPIMSIISGSMGLIYSLIVAGIHSLVLISFLTVVARNSQTLPGAEMFRGIASGLGLIIALAMIGTCGYSGVYGIIELTGDKRNAKPSKLAGMTCLGFCIVNFVIFFIAMSLLFSMSNNMPSSNEASAAARFGAALVVGLIIQVFYLAIPFFVFMVGVFRK